MDSGIPTLMTLVAVGCGFSFICPPSSPLDQGLRVWGLWGQGCDSFFLESRCLVQRLFADGCVDSQNSRAGGGGVFPNTDAHTSISQPILSPKQSCLGFSAHSECAASSLTTCWEMGRK